MDEKRARVRYFAEKNKTDDMEILERISNENVAGSACAEKKQNGSCMCVPWSSSVHSAVIFTGGG